MWTVDAHGEAGSSCGREDRSTGLDFAPHPLTADCIPPSPSPSPPPFAPPASASGKRDKAGQRVNIWTNFEDYKLPPPVGLLRCDLHTWPFRCWWCPGLACSLFALPHCPALCLRVACVPATAKKQGTMHCTAVHCIVTYLCISLPGSPPPPAVCLPCCCRPDLEEVLDALICDPPYGVREGGLNKFAYFPAPACLPAPEAVHCLPADRAACCAPPHRSQSVPCLARPGP